MRFLSVILVGLLVAACAVQNEAETNRSSSLTPDFDASSFCGKIYTNCLNYDTPAACFSSYQYCKAGTNNAALSCTNGRWLSYYSSSCVNNACQTGNMKDTAGGPVYRIVGGDAVDWGMLCEKVGGTCNRHVAPGGDDVKTNCALNGTTNRMVCCKNVDDDLLLEAIKNNPGN